MQIGDYIRTEKGIAKIIGKRDDIRFAYPNAWVTDTYLEINDDTEYVYDDQIWKSSPKILDIVEQGDYIDGKEVVKAYHFADGFNRIELFGGKAILNQTKITSIVTKEQFESMKYRLERKKDYEIEE